MARILIIDDESNLRMMTRLALQHVGHSVETAADGPDGLDRFEDGREWDVVLLDQRMPGMEGLEVLREIRRRDPKARVVMITAFGTIDLAVEAMKAGARDFLRKPFTAETLRGTVQAVLAAAPTRSYSDAQPGSQTTFSMTTINGYGIESSQASGERDGADLSYRFVVTSPLREVCECMVVLPGFFVELVKAHTDCEQMPGGERFWHALGEENLANYLWQNSDFPPEAALRVEELTPGIRRWIDSVISYHRQNAI